MIEGKETRPPSEEIQFRSKRIALKIKGLVETHSKAQPATENNSFAISADELRFMMKDRQPLTGPEAEEAAKFLKDDEERAANTRRIVFVSKANPELNIALHLATSTPSAISEFSDAPKDLIYPAVMFQEWDSENPQERTTPSGKLPSVVIGSDQQIYDFMNSDFFSTRGQSSRYEEGFHSSSPDKSLDEELDLSGYSRSTLLTLSFTPVPFSRHRPLLQDEIAHIEQVLEEIESGNYQLHPSAL